MSNMNKKAAKLTIYSAALISTYDAAAVMCNNTAGFNIGIGGAINLTRAKMKMGIERTEQKKNRERRANLQNKPRAVIEAKNANGAQSDSKSDDLEIKSEGKSQTKDEEATNDSTLTKRESIDEKNNAIEQKSTKTIQVRRSIEEVQEDYAKTFDPLLQHYNPSSYESAAYTLGYNISYMTFRQFNTDPSQKPDEFFYPYVQTQEHPERVPTIESLLIAAKEDNTKPDSSPNMILSKIYDTLEHIDPSKAFRKSHIRTLYETVHMEYYEAVIKNMIDKGYTKDDIIKSITYEIKQPERTKKMRIGALTFDTNSNNTRSEINMSNLTVDKIFAGIKYHDTKIATKPIETPMLRNIIDHISKEAQKSKAELDIHSYNQAIEKINSATNWMDAFSALREYANLVSVDIDDDIYEMVGRWGIPTVEYKTVPSPPPLLIIELTLLQDLQRLKLQSMNMHPYNGKHYLNRIPRPRKEGAIPSQGPRKQIRMKRNARKMNSRTKIGKQWPHQQQTLKQFEQRKDLLS